jgi:two-component system, cell cycle response regulator
VSGAAKPRALAEAGTDLPVLLAEDDPVARLVASRLLKKAGYEVHAVEDGVQALAAFDQRFFPILLTDWEMPGLDGISLIRELRSRETAGYVYVLLLTGLASHEHLVAGLEAGADDYLVKPVDEAELFARLKTARRVIELERRLRQAEHAALQLSLTDALTGVFNRRHLMAELSGALLRMRRYPRPLALLMADIDRFKTINDNHGHQAGDEVLQLFAGHLKTAVREGIDWVVRYGGEEFAIVLPETDLAGAVLVAERLRAGTEALAAGHATLPVFTASFGVTAAHADNPGLSVESLIAAADSCLYGAKIGGRNRVQSRAFGAPVVSAP